MANELFEQTKWMAAEIRKQVKMMTWGSVGARNFTWDSENRTLICQITIHRNVTHFLKIHVNASDLYNVTLIRITRRPNMRRIQEMEAIDVYCENLDEVIYRMGTPIARDPKTYTEIGIVVEAKDLDKAVAA